MKKHVALIVGTRPEAIKMAPVYFALKQSAVLEPLLWSTGQHREMLRQTLACFSLQPDRDLDLMLPGQTLGASAGRIISESFALLEAEPPDCVLVQGDTTSAFGVALSAFYAGIPIGHVEAGLRTETVRSPFPEELNRRLITEVADYHFAPTDWALANLRDEGVTACWNTGNTVIDALQMMVERVREVTPATLPEEVRSFISTEKKLVLITGHRRENFGAGFESLCSAIRSLAEKFPVTHFLYPVHLNPQVQEPVFRLLSDLPNIMLTEPLDYESFVYALDKSYMILSDSGGIQEEAPHLGKPVLVMRESTERPEAVAAGTSKLVGTSFEKIVTEVSTLLSDLGTYEAMSAAKNPYGDGTAASRICGILEEVLNK